MLVAVLVFGRKLPDAARAAGKKFHEFRKSVDKVQTEMRQVSVAIDKEIKETAGDIERTEKAAVAQNAGTGGSGNQNEPAPSGENPYEHASDTPEGGPKSNPAAAGEIAAGGLTPAQSDDVSGHAIDTKTKE
jgi:Sec-independent protein translocase protein TatA